MINEINQSAPVSSLLTLQVKLSPSPMLVSIVTVTNKPVSSMAKV